MSSVIAEISWVEHPPASAHVRVDEMHYRDPLRGLDFVFWRNRWCIVATELLEDLFSIDRDPNVGIEWVHHRMMAHPRCHEAADG